MSWPKGVPQSPDLRAKLYNTRLATLEATRAKINAALATSEVRAKISARLKVALAKPGVKARMSAASKAAWARPGYHSKMCALRKSFFAANRGRCCVYCGSRRILHLVPDGKDLFACRDVKGCEQRIIRARVGA